MRNRNGYGLASTTATTRSGSTPSPRLRRPVTARGREVLESSRRRVVAR